MSQEPKLWLKRNLQSVMQRLISENPDYDELLYLLDEVIKNSLVDVPLTTSEGDEIVTSSGDKLMGRLTLDSKYKPYLINAYIVIFLLNKGSIGEVEDIIERYT